MFFGMNNNNKSIFDNFNSSGSKNKKKENIFDLNNPTYQSNEFSSLYLDKENTNFQSFFEKSQSNLTDNKLNIKASNYGNRSLVNKIIGVESNFFTIDDEIHLSDMYKDPSLDKRVFGGLYNKTLTDVYQDEDSYAVNFGLFGDGKLTEQSKNSFHSIDISGVEESRISNKYNTNKQNNSFFSNAKKENNKTKDDSNSIFKNHFDFSKYSKKIDLKEEDIPNITMSNFNNFYIIKDGKVFNLELKDLEQLKDNPEFIKKFGNFEEIGKAKPPLKQQTSKQFQSYGLQEIEVIKMPYGLFKIDENGNQVPLTANEKYTYEQKIKKEQEEEKKKQKDSNKNKKDTQENEQEKCIEEQGFLSQKCKKDPDKIIIVTKADPSNNRKLLLEKMQKREKNPLFLRTNRVTDDEIIAFKKKIKIKTKNNQGIVTLHYAGTEGAWNKKYFEDQNMRNEIKKLCQELKITSLRVFIQELEQKANKKYKDFLKLEIAKEVYAGYNDLR